MRERESESESTETASSEMPGTEDKSYGLDHEREFCKRPLCKEHLVILDVLDHKNIVRRFGLAIK